MMSTRGWLDFIEEMTAILETTNQLNTVKNEQELYLAKGEMNILSLIINWQAASEATWRDLNENTN